MNGLFKTNYGGKSEMDCDKKSLQHLLKAVRGKIASSDEDEGDFGGGGEDSPADVALDAVEGTKEGSPADDAQDMETAMQGEEGMEGEEGGEEGDSDAMAIIRRKIEAGRDEGPRRPSMRLGAGPSDDFERSPMKGKGKKYG